MTTRVDAKNFEGIGTHFDGQTSLKSGSRYLSDEALAELYVDPYARFSRIIVDRPAEDATRRGWEIQVDESGDGVDPFADEMQRLDVVSRFRKAHEKARLYGGAAIVMIVDDDGALDEPISGNVRGIRALHVFSRVEIKPNEYYTDIEHKNFGEPRNYWLSPKVKTEGLSAVHVHADRVIRFDGLEVPDEFSFSYDGWGQSVLEAAYAVLCDTDTAVDSVREAIDQFQYSILKLQGLSALLTGADGDDNSGFQRRLDGIEEGKRRTKHVVIDAEDDYEQTGAPFNGLVESYQIVQQNLSAVTRIPITLLFGQSPSGLSTDDQSGTRNYYDGIRAIQKEKYEPGICRVVELLALAGVGPAEGWAVNFHDLLVPSEAENAETKKINAETDAVNIQHGVISPEEARSRYSVSGYQHDLVLDTSDAEADEASYSEMMERLQGLMESGEELPVPEASEDDTPPESEEQAPDDREFNGAQIASMADVVQRVAEGALPKGGAIEILMLGFNISEAHAERFFEDQQIREPDPEDQD